MTKVCLNMIVKNESRVITRLLKSVAPYIDSYCICDTGSTDNTEEIITNFFSNECQPPIPGKITHEPFRDFAHNRSFSLKACEGMDNADFVLLLDADMIFWTDYSPEEFRKLLVKDVYLLMQGCETFMYKNVRIVRNNRGMHYWGVTHEYVVIPDGNVSDLMEWKHVFIKDIGDGGAKADKFERDIRLLTKGLEDKPNDERYTFYLANSYYCLMRYDEAIPHYRRRAELGGFGEEVWYSLFRIGECYRHKGDIANSVHWYLNAYQYSDYRCENLYEVVKMFREKGQNRLAKLYYDVAERIRKTGNHDDHLFTSKDVYDFRLDYELSIIGYYCSDAEVSREDLRKVTMRLLNHPHFDLSPNVLSNYKFYTQGWVKEYCAFANHSSSVTIEKGLERLKNLSNSIQELSTGKHVKDLIASKMESNSPFWASTPSIVALPGTGEGVSHEWLVNIRFVNYYVGERGEYINQKHIQTVNLMVEIDVDGKWKKNTLSVMEYDPALDGVYVGLEDVRLFCPYASVSESRSLSIRMSDDSEEPSQQLSKNWVLYNCNRGLDQTSLGERQKIAVECGKIEYEYSLNGSEKNVATLYKTENGHLINKAGMSAVEKNWGFLPSLSGSGSSQSLSMIYHWHPLTIGKVAHPSSTNAHPTRLGNSYSFEPQYEYPTPTIFKHFRGSTNGIVVGDEIWVLCHIVSYEERRYYYHTIVALDVETYKPLKYTQFFTFEKDKVEYCLGMTHEKCVFEFDRRVIKEYILFGYSVMDRSTKTCLIPVDQIRKSFMPL